MMQTRVSIALFPAEVVAQDLVKQIVVFSLFLVFLTLYGVQASIHWIAVVPLLVTQLCLILAVAFLVALLVPFLPDLKYLVTTGLLLMMFGSGIFYSYELILPKHRQIFFLNPMANLIKNYRDVLLNQQWPDWGALITIFLISFVILFLSVYFLSRHRTTYARIALEN